MSDRYAVFGNPIEHSLSPSIHALFAEQTRQDMHYEKCLVGKDEFVSMARAFFDGGGLGLNITVPFKEEACRFADVLTERARAAQAVNTLAPLADGRILGDNTDGAGFIWDIRQRLNWPIAQRRVAILGAGGAVRGILLPLLAEQPQLVVLANRTASKAQSLAAEFGIESCPLESLSEQAPFDLIVNGTSASLSGERPIMPPAIDRAYYYDLVYAKQPTPFMQNALDAGSTNVADGWGMLVGQAAEAFYLWRQQRPDAEAVFTALR